MNTCETCKTWSAPAWDTGGFGTCYLPSTMKDKCAKPVIRALPSGWIGTHKTFGCILHVEKTNGLDHKA